jgi:hypothetical protein
MAEPILPEMQDISRQRDLAKLLLQKGLNDNLQGQMVSGRYVGASPIQGIANIYSAYKGNQMIKEADRKQAELAEMLRQQGEKDFQAYGEAITPIAGVEAKPEFIPRLQTAMDDQGMPTMGYQAPVEAVPEKKADFAKGMQILRSSKDPETRQLAKLLMAEQMKTLILPEGSTAIRGSLFGSGGQTIQGAPKEPTEYKEYVKAKEGGFQGSFFDYQTALKKSGATNVTVPVNTEKSYGSAFGQGLAKNDLDLYDTAQRAPEVLNNVLSTKKLLDSGNVYTGFGANAKLDLARVGTALGVVGKETADKVANTQQLFSNRAQATLDSIKSSGLGAGQGFSNKDREFLEAAKLGNITYDRETLNRQLLIEEKVARAAVNKWNTRYKSIPKSAIDPTGINPVSIPSEGAIDTGGGSGRGWRMK